MRLILLSALLLAPTLVVGPAAGQQALVEFDASPDITIAVNADGTTVEDADAVNEPSFALAPLGLVPPRVDLSGFHELDSGDFYIVLDTAEVLGAVTAEPRDVVQSDGIGGFSIVLDGSIEGIPDGARIDAVSEDQGGDLILSFDVTVDLGDGVIADDEDLVSWNPADGFAVYLDGGAAGIPANLDLDAVNIVRPTSILLLSFDGSGQIDGINFDDEDVMEYSQNAGTWSLSIDMAAGDPGWAAADLDAFRASRDCGPLGGDTDGDGLCDSEDPCIFYANTLPIDPATDLAGAFGSDGIPGECQCGDTDGDGRHLASDIGNVALCVNGNISCDLDLFDTDGNGTASDILLAQDVGRVGLAANGALFPYSLTCGRRPEGTPAPVFP